MNCLITGAEQGLGQEIANLLEKAGHYVANIEGRKLRDAAQARSAVEWLVKDEMNRAGPRQFQVVINNFGINHLSWIGATESDDWKIMWCNVMVPYWIVDSLVRNGNGAARVINIASQTYRVPQRCTTLYSASKAALVSMTRTMARELAPSGWVINAVAPGKIEGTEMSERTDAQVLGLRGWSKEDADEYARKMIPAGRFTNTTEVASAVLALLSMPSYVNGICLDVMGGV